MKDLKILSHIHPQSIILKLPPDQYHTLSIINTYMGPNNETKWLYYFITSSTEIRKLYIINLIINMLKRRSLIYFLLASTEVTA